MRPKLVSAIDCFAKKASESSSIPICLSAVWKPWFLQDAAVWTLSCSETFCHPWCPFSCFHHHRHHHHHHHHHHQNDSVMIFHDHCIPEGKPQSCCTVWSPYCICHKSLRAKIRNCRGHGWRFVGDPIKIQQQKVMARKDRYTEPKWAHELYKESSDFTQKLRMMHTWHWNSCFATTKSNMCFWIWSRNFTYPQTQFLENVWKILSALACLGLDCPHHVALEPSVFHYRFFRFWDTAAFLGFLKRFRKLQNLLCLSWPANIKNHSNNVHHARNVLFLARPFETFASLVFRMPLQRLWPWSKLRTCLPFVNHALRPLLVSLGFQLIDFKCSLVALVGESCVNRARNTWLELPVAGYHFRYCLWMQVLSKCSDDCVVPVILSRNEVVFMKSGHRNETSTTYQEVSKNLAISTTFTDSTATCDGSLSWQTQALVQKAMWTKDWCLKDRKTREQRCFFFVFKHVGQMFFLMFFFANVGLLMLGEYSSFVEFVWVVWFQVMTSFVCHWWCVSWMSHLPAPTNHNNLVGWQAMKMIRAMWFTLFGSILRHWHSNIAAGCNASKEISSAMRRCPVIRWLHGLRSKYFLPFPWGASRHFSYYRWPFSRTLGGFVTVTNLQ